MLAADLRSLEGLLRILTSQVSLIIDESAAGFLCSIPKLRARLAQCRKDLHETVLEIRQGCIATLVDHRPSGTGLKYLLLLDETASSIGAVGSTMSALGDLDTPGELQLARIDHQVSAFRRLAERVKGLVRSGVDAVWAADDRSVAVTRSRAIELRAMCGDLAESMRSEAARHEGILPAASRVISGCQLIECACHRIIGVADDAERLFGDCVRGVLPFTTATGEPLPPARHRRQAGSVL